MTTELVTAFELKAMPDAATGVFEGYGAVFGNVDSHGDVIMPGAFKASLDRHRSSGTMPPLHVEHHWAQGATDQLPAGVWTDLVEDDRGLKATGKLSALDTEYGRRVYSLMKDGALRGLSIAFSVPPGGADRSNPPRGATRALKQIDLLGLDIVKSPSNGMARVAEVKGLLAIADRDTASKAVASAIGVHLASMAGGDSPTAEERAAMLRHLQNAHEALTGRPMPIGMKVKPETIREFQAIIKTMMNLSNSEARDIADHGFKSTSEAPRDEVSGAAITKDVLADLKSLGSLTLS